ncbi:MAG: ParB N-terminal domain-containing protein [Acidobacteriota bacterium]|nr:ParB N-terminal domain-containing protein [Acidobacteriota bacterium]
MKAQHIERIPISHIRVVNPRSRNKIAFRVIVNNIGAVGLKKPITVFRRKPDKDGTCYDLVCGQGRLEAVAALGGKDIPAIVTEAIRKERFLMSLIENVARKRPRSSELLHEVRRLKKAGYKHVAMAEMLGMGHTYINGIVRLLNCGEDQLVKQVEAGTIPLSIAVKIATAGNTEVQRALNEAYQSGDLRGAKLRAVERLIATRSRDKNRVGESKVTLSGGEMLQEYEAFTEQQRALVKRASIVHERLAIVTASMRALLADSQFVRLLLGEGLDTLPEQLAARVKL